MNNSNSKTWNYHIHSRASKGRSLAHLFLLFLSRAHTHTQNNH